MKQYVVGFLQQGYKKAKQRTWEIFQRISNNVLAFISLLTGQDCCSLSLNLVPWIQSLRCKFTLILTAFASSEKVSPGWLGSFIKDLWLSLVFKTSFSRTHLFSLFLLLQAIHWLVLLQHQHWMQWFLSGRASLLIGISPCLALKDVICKRVSFLGVKLWHAALMPGPGHQPKVLKSRYVLWRKSGKSCSNSSDRCLERLDKACVQTFNVSRSFVRAEWHSWCPCWVSVFALLATVRTVEWKGYK